MPDLLHVGYLGVYQRFVAHVLWECLTDNVWHCSGGLHQQEDEGIECAVHDMQVWYEAAKVPTCDRLGQLTRAMVGARDSREFKAKGVETGVLVGWATALCSKFKTSMKHGEHLEAAGQALQKYMKVLKESSQIMTWESRCQLVESCLRHLCLVKESRMTLVPKHHLWIHLTLRSETQNPRVCMLLK